VVGKKAADEYAKQQKKAKAEYEKYTADEKEKEKAAAKDDATAATGSSGSTGASGASGAVGDTIKTTLDNLYAVSHVPDQDAIEAALDAALGPAPGASGASGARGATGPGTGDPSYGGQAQV
jgi:hypothetical protein